MGDDEPPPSLLDTLKARDVSDKADAQRDKYTVVREIGKGTFGVAYLVKNKVSQYADGRYQTPRCSPTP